MAEPLDLINKRFDAEDIYMSGPGSDDLTFPRDPIVERNIRNWQQLITFRYSSATVDRLLPFVTADYFWSGTLGTAYSYHDELGGEILVRQAQVMIDAFEDLKITSHMFGEGCMVGNYFFIEGVHQGDYLDVPATGNAIKVLGLAFARFDDNGLLVEERELIDEMTLLRQVGFIKDKEAAGFLGLIANQKYFSDGPLYEPISKPALSSLLFNRGEGVGLDQRDPCVLRNIANWKKFTSIKYKYQSWGKIEEVMHPAYITSNFGGMRYDHSIPEVRRRAFEFYERELIEHPDIRFDSCLFGEGNVALYNVIPQFTHTGSTWGLKPSGREVAMFNISIGRFDREGRIVEETEVHDFVGALKQMGYIENSSHKLSLLSVLRDLQ
ncbi:ester cyclase [SAR92 clade bacterium H246]